MVLGYLAMFWVIYEILIRGLFLVYNTELSSQLSAAETFLIFLHGLKMDVSLLGYFLMASGFLFAMSMLVRGTWPYLAINLLNIFCIVVGALVTTIDLELYRHWGFRLNSAPFSYLQHTGPEAMGSVHVSVVFKLLLIGGALITIFLFVYDRLVAQRMAALEPCRKRGFAILLGLSAAMVVPVRGSFSVAPMNTGFVYFHKTNAFANHAAINVIWNFFYNLNNHTRMKYPEDFLPKAVAEQHFRELYPQHDGRTTRVLKTSRPNIILFILESFTADVIEPLGGRAGVAPNLNNLCSEGILFTNFYASGDRTDKGLISILSGYPAQPVTSIIKNPAKTQRLPYLSHYMQEMGYSTSFVYGGDIDFANFRSYLTNSRFDHITADEDFPDDYNQSKWGVHDHIVFERALEECDTTTRPFFKVILSLSSHEPFDVPMAPRFPGEDWENLFLNSCSYTDRSVGEFIHRAKASDWWDDTVIIFIAHHGIQIPDCFRK